LQTPNVPNALYIFQAIFQDLPRMNQFIRWPQASFTKPWKYTY